MNEIKKCSISGIAFVFEKVAYNRLNEYIESLKKAYKNSPESSEIIADIEARIAELILSAQRSSDQVVCLPLVENIIAQLGSAEDIAGDGDSDTKGNDPATDTRISRRLYRDIEDSLMRATAEKDTLSILLNEKILLMSEIVGDKRVSYFFRQSSATKIEMDFLWNMRKQA